MRTDVKRPLCLLLAAGLFGACASVPRRIDGARASVTVHLAGADDVDPGVHPACEQALASALVRHGFTVAPGGTRFEVSAVFIDLPAMTLGGGALSTTDFTGVWRGAETLTLTASATGSDTAETSGLLRPAARARIGGCLYGAERLVDALVERLMQTPRSAR